MKVWVVEWSKPDDGDFKSTIWASEKDALQAACKDMEKAIDSWWDMDDEPQAEAADEIKLHVAKGRLREAISRWNEYMNDHNFDYGQWYTVEEKEVLSFQNGTATIPAPPPVAYQATTAGATCRKCNTPNEHAYADSPDGTYCCRQCSIFSNIFGVKP